MQAGSSGALYRRGRPRKSSNFWQECGIRQGKMIMLEGIFFINFNRRKAGHLFGIELPLFTTLKAGSTDWEGQTVRITENCIVDFGFWK